MSTIRICVFNVQFHRSSVKKRQNEIKERKIIENRRSKKVQPGEDEDLPVYTFANTNKNPTSNIYAWGMACFGALGNPEFIHPAKKTLQPLTSVHHPVRVSRMELQRVKDVACGYGYSVFAAKNKGSHLFGTGINNQGQIGYHEERPGHPLEVLIAPCPIKLPVDKEDSVSRIECGQAHTLVLMKSGQVFSFGSNAFGQCGRPVIPNEDYMRSQVIHPVRIKDLEENDFITDIACGINHSMLLTKSGKVYSCGWSADGQTGLGHYDNQESMERLKGDIDGEKIVKVACVADNVLAINDNGEVFGWGNSEYSQLHMATDEQQVNSPVKLNLGDVGKVLDVASGGSMCMVLNDQHDVWVWGYGILGQGEPAQHSSKPLLLPPTLFGRNEFNPDAVTTSVSCGVNTSAAINSYGDLYTWGKNKGSCLGLGSNLDQYFPLKVNMGGQVKKVCLGFDHSIAMCKPYL